MLELDERKRGGVLLRNRRGDNELTRFQIWYIPHDVQYAFPFLRSSLKRGENQLEFLSQGDSVTIRIGTKETERG